MPKVLIAEDERGCQLTLRTLVKNLGYSPVVCSNGKQALSILIDNPDFALIITDVLMPEMDGRELLKEVKANPEISQIPFIIVSGNSKLSEISDLLRQGFSYFVPKPIDVRHLSEYITRLVETRSQVTA